MNSRKSALSPLLFGLLCLCAQRAFSGTPAGEIPGALESAITLAVANDPSAAAALAAVRSANERVRQARASFWPTVDFVGEIDDTVNYDTYSGIVATVNIPTYGLSTVDVLRYVPRYQVAPELRVQYSLYNGGHDLSFLEQNKLDYQASEISHAIALQGLLYDVSQAYFLLRKNCVLLDSARQRLEFSSRKAEQDEARRAQGSLAEVDYRESALAQVSDRIAAEQSQLDVDTAYRAYVKVVDRAALADPSAHEPCRFDHSVGDDIEVAMNASDPRILQEERDALELRSAEKRVDVERAAYRPKVNLIYEFDEIGRTTNVLGTNSFGSALNLYRRDQFIGLQVTFNLFNGFFSQSKVAEAEAERERIKLSNERELSDIEVHNAQNKAAVRRAELQLELARAQRDLARSKQRIAEERLNGMAETQISLAKRKMETETRENDVQAAELDLVLSRLPVLFVSAVAGSGS